MSRVACPATIAPSWEWINAADEWSDALRAPARYSRAAATNYVEHHADGEVDAGSLRDAIEWERTRRRATGPAAALGSLGGKATAKSRTKRQRSEAARKAVTARWEKRQKS